MKASVMVCEIKFIRYPRAVICRSVEGLLLNGFCTLHLERENVKRMWLKILEASARCSVAHTTKYLEALCPKFCGVDQYSF